MSTSYDAIRGEIPRKEIKRRISLSTSDPEENITSKFWTPFESVWSFLHSFINKYS